jgi:hypothetical protein
MLLRLLLVLLVVFNLAAAGWGWWGQHAAPARRESDRGIPTLRLLSEMPPAAISAPAAAVAQPASATSVAAQASVPASIAPPVVPAAPVPRNDTCLALGPFATQADLRSTAAALQPLARRQRTRQEQSVQSRGWWVFLPAQRSRELALAQAKKLSASGITDYFVVGSGGQPNTISLGLFKDPANARKRRDQVVQAGFPAQLSERTESVPVYWLDLVLSDGARLARNRIPSGVAARAIGCF